jgi:hypothetical protein
VCSSDLIIIPIAVTSFLTFGVSALIGGTVAASTTAVVSRFAASTTFSVSLRFLLPFFASDADHPVANGEDQGDSAWEHWPYLELAYNGPFEFVKASNAACDLDWTFDSDSYGVFGCIVQASVCFAEAVYMRGSPQTVDKWVLEDRATYTASTEIWIWP